MVKEREGGSAFPDDVDPAEIAGELVLSAEERFAKLGIHKDDKVTLRIPGSTRSKSDQEEFQKIVFQVTDFSVDQLRRNPRVLLEAGLKSMWVWLDDISSGNTVVNKAK